jgi:hypothetical protein
MKSLGYDGIDTDWEENFDNTLFMAFHKDLRDSINKLKPIPCLSIAAEDWYPITGQVYPYVDMIDDMYYGGLANAYPGYLQAFINVGAPKNKLAPGFGEDPGTGNLNVQQCIDLCNLVVNNGYGGIMHWDIVNKGNCPADYAAIAAYVAVPTGVIGKPPSQFTTPLSLSVMTSPATRMGEIRYSIPTVSAGNIDVGVYNIQGALVKTLVHGPANGGVFSLPFAQTWAAGTYIVRLSANNAFQASQAFITK